MPTGRHCWTPGTPGAIPVPDLAELAAALDPAHAELAAAAQAAIDTLAEHLQRLQDSCLLSQTAADFAQTVLQNFTALQAVVNPAGATATRPTSPPVGLPYFDTDLGRPVWFSGTGWVDATGGAA